ncbi:DUF7674 family protein [Gottfriedia solisilvae]|uniref:DUF7674 domain-containing protein n=1 Tax=Gottfriedia solisilvae TaxID=1516104 RepID=A0A8J3ADH8_9BACI|nr:hypothetical protein [Gottfriedia solisilvae]GGI11615.1 hypothetical protein GCM10007380_08730 [Gottfriedia solisilvae]
MEYKNLAYIFVNQFKEYNIVLQEHIEFNGEILNHVFFGECNEHFIKLINEDQDNFLLQELFDFFELMAIDGDIDIKDLLSVTILARLGDSKKILNIAYKYMRFHTKQASNEYEKALGRY